LAVLVVGALLGPVFGTASVALYVLLGGLGAPIFANGGSGFGGPTSGYFIGFIIAALVVGLVSRRACALPPNRAVPRLLVAMLLGLVAIYLGGLAWLVLRSGLSIGEALSAGFAPFIVGDFLEAIFAVAVTAVVAARLRPRS
jgi:biotin transport system substrate-specific component